MRAGRQPVNAFGPALSSRANRIGRSLRDIEDLDWAASPADAAIPVRSQKRPERWTVAKPLF